MTQSKSPTMGLRSSQWAPNPSSKRTAPPPLNSSVEAVEKSLFDFKRELRVRSTIVPIAIGCFFWFSLLCRRQVQRFEGTKGHGLEPTVSGKSGARFSRLLA
jgi:hypothetical protein